VNARAFSEKASFLVEKVEKGIRIAIKGHPDTSEVIPFAVLKESAQKAAQRCTEAHLGPRHPGGYGLIENGGVAGKARCREVPGLSRCHP
jgi:hypothetical protein